MKIFRPGDPATPVNAKIIRPEQEAAIVRMMDEETHSILLADAMGAGKTVRAAEWGIRLSFERVLIIGVKDTYAAWSDRIEAQSDGAIKLRRLDSTKAGRIAFADFLAGSAGWFFVGSQWLTAQDFAHVKSEGEVESNRIHLKTYAKMKALDAIIFDEVHVVSNRKSVGLRTVKTLKTDWKLAMSGTWYRNDFAGAWSVTRWLWPDLIDGSFIRWADEWCAREELYLPNGQSTMKVTGEKNPGTYIQTLPCYIREEAVEEAPDPEVFMVDLTPVQREQYNALEADMVVWMGQHGTEDRAPLVADLPIVLRARLRTAALAEMSFDANGDIRFDVDAPSSKLWALRQIVDRPDWAGERVIIGTDSKRFAKVTVARMRKAGYDAVEWSGDVSSKERDEIKRAFIAGEIHYLVTVIPSFSTGNDGFQVCSKIVTLSASEDNSQNQQWVARCFRPGRVGDFQHVIVNAADTYDMGIFHSLNRQSAAQAVTLRVNV